MSRLLDAIIVLFTLSGGYTTTLLLPPFCCSKGSKGLTMTATLTEEGVAADTLASASAAVALCP
jgi:hypothetical protein